MLDTLEKIKAYEYENPMIERRKTSPGEFCNVVVVNSQGRWYWMLQDEEIFCEINRNYDKQIVGFTPCRLSRSTISDLEINLI